MQNISSHTVENVEIEVFVENVENEGNVENVEYQFFIVENVECHDIIKNLFDSSIVSSDAKIDRTIFPNFYFSLLFVHFLPDNPLELYTIYKFKKFKIFEKVRKQKNGKNRQNRKYTKIKLIKKP